MLNIHNLKFETLDFFKKIRRIAKFQKEQLSLKVADKYGQKMQHCVNDRDETGVPAQSDEETREDEGEEEGGVEEERGGELDTQTS